MRRIIINSNIFIIIIIIIIIVIIQSLRAFRRAGVDVSESRKTDVSKVVVVVVADGVVIVIYKCSIITSTPAVAIGLRGGTTLASQMYSSFYVCFKPCIWHP